MKNSFIKNKLKVEANKINIIDHTDSILKNTHHEVKLEAKAKPRLHIGSILATMALAIASVVFFVSIFLRNQADGPNQVDLTSEASVNVMGKEILALGNLVDNYDANNENKLMALRNIDYSIYNNIAKEINYYITTSNSLIDNEYKVVVEEIKDKTYSYKMIITLNDGSSYEALYNQELGDDNTNIEIEGIITIDTKAYILEGERSDDGDEVEIELKLSISDSEYIKIKNELENNNENEYSYEFYKNNELIKGVSMECESEEGSRTTEIEIISGNVVHSYELIADSNGLITCEYQDNELELLILIEEKDDHYIYKFVDIDYEYKLKK